MCWPFHDSPAVFNSLLDPVGGGSWEVEFADPAERASEKVLLLAIDETNIIVTRHSTAQGSFEVRDMMYCTLRSAVSSRHRSNVVVFMLYLSAFRQPGCVARFSLSHYPPS